MINEKGQAFDVFKLLIAAIIAMAILGILVPIIMQILGIITKNPADETKTLLSKMYDQKSSMQETDEVQFKPNTSLAKATLVERTPLSADQVCYSNGDYEGSEEWAIAGDKLIFRGPSDRTIKIAVICSNGQDQLMADIGDYFPEKNYELERECGCAETEQTCCGVILRKT